MEGPCFDRPDRILRGTECRDQNHGNIRVQVLNRGKQLDPCHLGHLNIRYNQIK